MHVLVQNCAHSLGLMTIFVRFGSTPVRMEDAGFSQYERVCCKPIMVLGPTLSIANF